MAILLMAFSILVFVFAGRMHRAGQAGKSRALLGAAILLGVLAVLAALNARVRSGALNPPAPATVDTTR